MAGSDNDESKTEDATDLKIDEARKKGNEPFSQEVQLILSLIAMTTLLSMAGGEVSGLLVTALSEILGNSDRWPLETTADFASVAKIASMASLLVAAPVVALMAVGGIMATVVQNPVAIKLERIKPDMSRISPASGFTRLFSRKGLVTFAKVVAKMAVVGIVSFIVLKRSSVPIQALQQMDPHLLPRQVQALVMDLLLSIVVPAVAIAAADIGWARWSWTESLRMTRQEVKDEHKQAAGDPAIKARVAAIARERSRRRMMSSVPKATLVVVNPTHYAVALRYQRSEGGAPVVVARGVDGIALKIRSLAERSNVPVIEDVGLARALYENTRLDQSIPPEFYVAIAKLLTMLYVAKSPSAKHVKG